MLLTLTQFSADQILAFLIVFVVLFALMVAVAEVLTRLTPTRKDDGAIKRLGSRVDRILDFLRVPNRIKPPDIGPKDDE